MRAPSRDAKLLAMALLTLAIAWVSPARASDEPHTVVLVATPEFRDPLYGQTILIAKPVGDRQHVGFILNKPTRLSVAEAFPDHGPSKSVLDPLYLGGPAQLNAVFALVKGERRPENGSIQLAPDLFLVFAKDSVDQVIETEADRARYFVGAVVWRPGELDEELKRGAWIVLEPETDLVLSKKTDGLWEELVRRAGFSGNAI